MKRLSFAAALMLPLSLPSAAPKSPPLRAFVDALPILKPLSPASRDAGIDIYQISEEPCLHRYHRDLPAAPAWGYDGQVPGPTIEAVSGRPVQVRWISHLPQKPLFPILGKSALPGLCGGLPAVRSTVHLHGGYVSGAHFLDPKKNDDGYPEAWRRPGQSQEASYPNQQPSATLWYHDHAMGISARNVTAGLYGFYLLHDKAEASMNLPQGAYEVPLAIQSRTFFKDGRSYYPETFDSEEVYGDCAVVNGKAWPYLKVEPRRYRFRILNASSSRSFRLRIQAGPKFWMIGSDGGLIEKAAELESLSLAPAERADLIVDFRAFAGQYLVLANDAGAQNGESAAPIPQIMQFRVSPVSKSLDSSNSPESLNGPQATPIGGSSQQRNIYFGSRKIADGREMLLLNGRSWDYPVEEKVKAGAIETWNLLNPGNEFHPFHLHFARFRVLGRQMLEPGEGGEAVASNAPFQGPDPSESGWKDTVAVPPRSITRILIPFGNYPGRYAYHCHIQEHEDMEMMRPFEVVAP